MASRKAAPTTIGNPSGVYLKIPLPPELAALLGGHVERATEIIGMLQELVGLARQMGDAVQAERGEIVRLRKRLRKR